MMGSVRRILLVVVGVCSVLGTLAGCGSWRRKLDEHEALPVPPTGVPTHLVEANALVERAVRVTDPHARFTQTLIHPERAPQLYKEVRVLYGASLDTFPAVLDRWLRSHGGRVLSRRWLDEAENEEPLLLLKLRLRMPEKVICWLEVRRRVPSQARLAIIIDDTGQTTRDLETAQALPAAITFAVLPHTPKARECADTLHQAGHTIMLHQPMEPLHLTDSAPLDPGPGAVRVDMEPAAIRTIVEENLSAVPHVVAVNNHMGSKATADETTMQAVLLVLREHRLPFIDSLTTGRSVCRQVAESLGVPCVARNADFLDNSRAPNAIIDRLTAACAVARRRGTAVAIGHYHPAMLNVLREFDFGDVELIPVTELFEIPRSMEQVTPAPLKR